ncbi:EAL domain-containing protein [Marinomonas sp. 2405UD68-3]|uniref:sensor domain-containing protein n=1 Tax=Marinomonas sp. 2405UD68-3 TaxID=3391835 RepID=UPI0039C93510
MINEVLKPVFDKFAIDNDSIEEGSFLDEVNTAVNDLVQQNGFLQNYLDLTSVELVQRYERLELSNHLFEATFNAARDAMLVTDKNTDICRFNDEFIRIWSIPDHWGGKVDKSELIKHLLSQVVDKESLLKITEMDVISEEPSSGQVHLKDGRLFEFESRMRYFQGEKVGRLYCINDITQEVSNQRILAQSQNDLILAHKLSKMGSWAYELSTNTIILSEGLLAILDLPKEDTRWRISRYLECIPEYERDKVNKAISKSLLSKGVFQVEHKLITPKGKEYYLSNQGGYEKGQQSTSPRLLGLVKDVTKDKDSIDRIKLSSQFFHSSLQGNILMDRERNILDFNEVAVQIFSLEMKDFKESISSRLSSAFSEELSIKNIWMKVYAEHKWAGEVNFSDDVLKDKTLWLSLEAYFDDDGVLTHYLAIFNDISESKKVQEQLTLLAYFDAQTMLPNRAKFEQYLLEAIANTKKNASSITLIYLDLDRFKYVNDSLGHHVGDELLIEVAERLQKNVPGKRMIARQGGDEFVVVLEDAKPLYEIESIAQGIIDSLSQPFELQGHKVFVGASMGVVNLPQQASDLVTAMQYADIALYKAKNAGKGCYRFWDDAFLKDATSDRMTIESSLREGIRNNELVLYYQPIVDASTGKIRSLEALVRWNHPEKGMIPPDDFIPIAEETNLILHLDEWVIHEVVRQQNEWKALGLTLCPISINISAPHISRPSLLDTFEHLIKESPFLVNLLQIEVTETAMMIDPDKATLALNKLFKIGVSSSIDDFGSGYTSLGYLKKLNADVLKIDRSFIDGITTDNFDHDVAKAIIALAASMSMKVVAEGVETKEQWAMLKQFGCDYLQGYYFYRPMMCDQVYELLQSR